MSDISCVFDALDTNVVLPKEMNCECGGAMTMLSTLLNYERPAYGTLHAVDALLMRGGIFIDWSDSEKASEILSMSVCTHHKNDLLINWKLHPFGNKYTHDKVLTCSLPQIVHEKNIRSNLNNDRPRTKARLNKEDTIAFIASTGRFCMVGTGVCSTHHKTIRDRNWGAIRVESDSEERMDGNGNELDDLRIDAVRSLCSLYGFTRFNSERNWDQLRPESQRKKITVMIKLQDELYRVCAGDNWRSMKESCLRKLTTMEKDSRVESIMDGVGQCLEDCSDKSARIKVVKLLTGLFTEKEIRAGTGASRYLIRQAKLSSFEEVRMLKLFKRERFDEAKVEIFLRFLARPEIIITLPNSAKNHTLSNGDDVSIATVARLYSYREIYSLFGQYCEELGKQSGLASSSDLAEFVRSKALGCSTAYKLMQVLTSNRQFRLTCVDAYQADAFDAFEELSHIVDELALLDEIDLQKTMELRRRIRVAKNFLFGEIRTHISKESTVVNHCWTHALNDGEDSRFASPCSHTHDSSCTECSEAMLLPTIMKKIVEGPHAIAERNKNLISHRLQRMIDICDESEELIRAYRQHLFRCVASEHDRRKIIDGLEDGHAFIVIDYAMKILPTDSIEKQSQWFAKAGISYHMSATIARINGQLVSHSFSHVSAVSKQDAMAVAGILSHVFSLLKYNGITHVHLRSDNAANYHNVALVAYILQLIDDLDITVISHIFSEAQYGKGRADREISLCKGKLNSFIDSGHPATTPEEILNGFTHNILLKGCSFYLTEVAQVEGSRPVLNGVKQYSSFRFERGVGILVRKHDSLGEGIMVFKDDLPPLKLRTTIHKEAGYLSHSEHFWKIMGKANDAVEEEVKGSTPIIEEEGGAKDFLRCNDMLCQSRFKTRKGLEMHVERGNHSYFKESQTVQDYAVRMFSNLIESTEEAQAAVHIDSLVPLANSSSEEKRTGWALKECLSESQVKSQITRILNLKKKEKEIGENGQPMQKLTEPNARGRKRKESQQSKESQKKKGRQSKKSLERVAEDVSDNSDVEEYPEEESGDEINSLEVMEQAVKENLNVIFSNEDSDEYEEEL